MSSTLGLRGRTRRRLASEIRSQHSSTTRLDIPCTTGYTVRNTIIHCKTEEGVQPRVLLPGVEGEEEEEEAGQGEQEPAQQHQPARHTLHHRIHCKKHRNTLTKDRV